MQSKVKSNCKTLFGNPEMNDVVTKASLMLITMLQV